MIFNSVAIGALKWSACALFMLAIACALFSVASDPASLPNRYFRQYLAYLERCLRSMFIMLPARYIVVGQLAGIALGLALGLGLSEPLAYGLVPAAIFGPLFYIKQLKKRRIKLIESKLDGFILALANALKATPSLGNALEYVEPLLPPPLDDEIRLALKEMRVGTTLDQALLNASARIQSIELDATLTGLLIARQVGGELPKILETTAANLREMTRLQGVVRTKTAEGKVQLFVVALFPAGIVVGFDLLSPGFFSPLVQHAFGAFIIGICVALWVVALVIARKVLAVDL